MSNADFLGKYKLDTMYVNPAGDITYITYVTCRSTDMLILYTCHVDLSF
ncbi:hypothetical protein KAR91_11915 [Candidatus Pacearchaeota archaeon]|nr:hypothetical protein [Candidatus Pacearchaeota archaeon]